VIELVETIRSFDESRPGSVDVSIKIAGGPLDCCKPPIHSPNDSGASNNAAVDDSKRSEKRFRRRKCSPDRHVWI
jgi:hypothetical protein